MFKDLYESILDSARAEGKGADAITKYSGLTEARIKEFLNANKEPSLEEWLGICRATEWTFKMLELDPSKVHVDFEYSSEAIDSLVSSDDANKIVDLFTIGQFFVEDGKLYFGKDRVEVSSEDIAKIARLLFKHGYDTTLCTLPNYFKAVDVDTIKKCKDHNPYFLDIALSTSSNRDDDNEGMSPDSILFINNLKFADRRWLISRLFDYVQNMTIDAYGYLEDDEMPDYVSMYTLTWHLQDAGLTKLVGLKDCDDYIEKYNIMANKLLADIKADGRVPIDEEE